MKAPNKRATRNRTHYNSEPSTLQLLNAEFNRNSREEELHRAEIARLESMPSEITAKHLSREAKKVTVSELANKKISVMQAKMPDIINKILAYMDKNPGVDPFAKFETLLAKFKTIDDEQLEIRRSVNLPVKSYYQELIAKVVQNNAHAALFTFADILTRSDVTISLKDLTAEEMASLQKNIEANPKIFYNEHFKKNYLKFFPDYISRMYTVSDVIHALSIKPSAYLNISETFKSTLYQSPSIFKNIANRASSALKYMSKQDLYYFGSEYTSSMGVAIMHDPDVLNNLSDDFFQKNSPKFIFSGYTKAKVSPVVNHYLNRFPTIARWLGVTIAYPTYSNGKIVNNDQTNSANSNITI